MIQINTEFNEQERDLNPVPCDQYPDHFMGKAIKVPEFETFKLSSYVPLFDGEGESEVEGGREIERERVSLFLAGIFLHRHLRLLYILINKDINLF